MPYPSRSEADLALCGILAFWTHGDAGRVDALFRRSGLMRPKSDRACGPGERYGRRTVRRAVYTCPACLPGRVGG
jgi:primase-polymerase (primpol)-like protein